MASLFGYINVEQPKFEILKKKKEYEIRKYEPSIAATTAYGKAEPSSSSLPSTTSIPDVSTGNTDPGHVLDTNGPTDSGKPESIDPVSDNAAFRRLANFIFNEKAPISMTAPVITNDAEMSFILPSSRFHALSEVPQPLDDRVQLKEIPASTLAVSQFSWFASPENVNERTRELKEALKRDGISLADENESPALFRYNPPWCLPFFRTNEIALHVTGFDDNEK